MIPRHTREITIRNAVANLQQCIDRIDNFLVANILNDPVAIFRIESALLHQFVPYTRLRVPRGQWFPDIGSGFDLQGEGIIMQGECVVCVSHTL